MAILLSTVGGCAWAYSPSKDTIRVQGTSASEEKWTCILTVDGKLNFSTRRTFVVRGDLLVGGPDIRSRKILLNDDRLLIAFVIDHGMGTRNARNIGRVEVDEPLLVYFIIDKLGGRSIYLSNTGLSAYFDAFSGPMESPRFAETALPKPELQSGPCTRG